jgi:predicted cupin superfamily sugar epimerase
MQFLNQTFYCRRYDDFFTATEKHPETGHYFLSYENKTSGNRWEPATAIMYLIEKGQVSLAI